MLKLKAGALDAAPNAGVLLAAPNAGALEAPKAGAEEKEKAGVVEAPNAGVLEAPKAGVLDPNEKAMVPAHWQFTWCTVYGLHAYDVPSTDLCARSRVVPSTSGI